VLERLGVIDDLHS
jgi:exoribonuclease R